MVNILNLNKKSERVIAIAPIRDGVIFPHTQVLLSFGRQKSVKALEAAYNRDRMVCFVMQKSGMIDNPTPSDLYSIGTLARIDRMIKTEEEVNVLITGISRVQILSYEAFEPILLAKLIELEEIKEESDEITALTKHLTNDFKKAMQLGKGADFLTFMNIMSGTSPQELADQIAYTLDIKPQEKQELLELISVKERLTKIAEYLSHEIKILEIEKKITSKTQQKFDKSVKEAVLRERLKTIEKELGEEEEDKEFKELKIKIAKSGMPEDVRKKAEKELKRLQQMAPFNPESSYIRTYLDWMTELPWSMKSPNNTSIKEAEKVLNEDHYGLEKIKERIVEFLSVMKLKGEKKQNTPLKTRGVSPTILCFVGPPGVGKTSLGKSIARALGRKFIRVSLGGIRDEAEIRGHRRTYVGALPGRIIQGIKQAGTKNPVFMLDEIDKLGRDFRGDPSSSLLEALDPEQNSNFSDHYLEVSFDLSDVFFITTCNVLDTIPPALKDRLEIIHFPGYTEEEKFHISKEFLWNKQIEAHALIEDQIKITDNALRKIIRKYTREAGVRNLEREIAQICRKVAKKIAAKEKSLSIGRQEKHKIETSNLNKFLGPVKFLETLAEKKDEIGMSTGLAWTEAGGDVLFIEVALMPGKSTLILTGQLGDVMKESCQAAMSYVRSRFNLLLLPEKFYQKIDVHVHVPEGAVPKDGPSAGIAIVTALVSALTKIPVKRTVGATGEITLRGRVLEIGGVKEKVIAAHRAGLKTVILPKDNKKDLEDIPKKVLKDLKFHFVSHMDEVLKIALVKQIKKEKEIIPKDTLTPIFAYRAERVG